MWLYFLKQSTAKLFCSKSYWTRETRAQINDQKGVRQTSPAVCYLSVEKDMLYHHSSDRKIMHHNFLYCTCSTAWEYEWEVLKSAGYSLESIMENLINKHPIQSYFKMIWINTISCKTNGITELHEGESSPNKHNVRAISKVHIYQLISRTQYILDYNWLFFWETLGAILR